MSLTYYGKTNPLVETFDFTPTKVSLEPVTETGGNLNEDAKPAKRLVLEGVFQRSDTPNLNKRVYPRKVWERLCGEKSPMMEKVKARAMVGHLEHPKDGTTDLTAGAILVTEVRLQEDGTVWGKALVYNTPAGRLVQEYIDTGTKIGISSRGTGSVDSKGVVQEDYNCDTWDIVYNPSTPGAHPKPTNESEEKPVTKPVNEDQSVNEEGYSSVEQQVLALGPDWIKSKTGLSSPDDVAKMQWRFFKWCRQRGAADTTVEAAWASFAKLYPIPTGGDAASSAAAAGAPPSEPAKVIAPPANDVPAATTVAQPNGSAKLPEKASEPVVAVALDEAGVALLAEVRAIAAKLTDENKSISEELKKVSAELETSATTVTTLNEEKIRLQAEVDKLGDAVAQYESTLAALTAVDVAAQVREAVEEVLSHDPRLAAFREVLDAQKSPAAVESRALKLIESLTVHAGSKPAEAPKPKTLEERVRRRTVVAEEKGLPVGRAVLESESDAGVTPPEPSMVSTHKGAMAAAGAIKRGLFNK